MKIIITKKNYLKLKESAPFLTHTNNFWIEIMKDNEIYYRELELEEKRKQRREKLKEINENNK